MFATKKYAMPTFSQNYLLETIRLIKKYAAAIAKALKITGPFNIQFMAKGNYVHPDSGCQLSTRPRVSSY